MNLPNNPPDEVALYDRQIRLWGMEAQARFLPPLLPTPTPS